VLQRLLGRVRDLGLTVTRLYLDNITFARSLATA